MVSLTGRIRTNLIALSTVLTFGALGWQSHLMDQQNDYSAEQAYQLKEQVSLERSAFDRESADSTKARRIELLSTIYDRVPCAESLPERCLPKASPRARQEAVVEFLELERGRGTLRPDLSGAPLAGLEFIAQDFHDVDLDEADLSSAVLASANFSGADLSGASLADATMMGSNLEEADMQFSDLSRTHLWFAKFNRADLSGAVLIEATMLGVETDQAILDGVDLTDSRNLDQADLDHALGNRFTKLPKGKVAPSSWSTRESASSEDGEKMRYAVQKVGHTLERWGKAK